MQNALELINKSFNDESLISIHFSGPRSKGDIKNINIQYLNKTEVKLEVRHQKHNDIKSFDFSKIDFQKYLSEFKQVLLKDKNFEAQILINKKLKEKIITKEIEVKTKHNRQKNYLIPDGEKCAFLVEIGVMQSNGKVKPNHYKKFRQINRFLEMVDDLFKNENKELYHIVDFGCGKSYLTFALYHYFINIKKVNAKITGIDLKQEVIDHCNNIAKNIDFHDLKFVHGFIHDFKTDDDIDFVVTLHACDTATDDAILFSLNHQASKMMFVPCCQHELNKQIENSNSQIMLKHGIFKDRMTALVTDTMRTQLLEACGYKVQSMEFIDLEHTAKNILLRCVKTERLSSQNQQAYQKYLDFKKQWNINPYLEKQLESQNFLRFK